MYWFLASGVTAADLGYLPGMLNDEDPRPAREQLDDAYPGSSHWRSDPKFTLNAEDRLCYPGDPPQAPVAMTWLRDEQIILYPQDFVVIRQKDGSFLFQRMD